MSSAGLITLGIGPKSTMQQFILVGLGKKWSLPVRPARAPKKRDRTPPRMISAEVRARAFELQVAKASDRMKNYQQQKDIEARKVAIREEQRQQVLQRDAIKLRAAQMERDRLDSQEVVTRKVVRQVVKEVLKEERDD